VLFSTPTNSVASPITSPQWGYGQQGNYYGGAAGRLLGGRDRQQAAILDQEAAVLAQEAAVLRQEAAVLDREAAVLGGGDYRYGRQW
jgi:hypothetical protein